MELDNDTATLADALNRSCHCIAVDPVKLRAALESSPLTLGVYDAILRERPHLFSSSPVFLARAQLDHMQTVIAAIETVIHSPAFGEWSRTQAPPIAHHDFGPHGVFLGYDFHFGRTGPQLIEINTNAGGALLNTVLAAAQQACCADVEAVLGAASSPRELADRFLAMFQAEWQLQRGAAALRTIAIVDQDPDTQYLHPEFLLFQELFRRAGLGALIVDVAALRHESGGLFAGEQRIDLVYNRLTDFSFAEPATAALRDAYLAGDVVVTPNPHTYARYADKRHLTILSDGDRLRAWGVPEATIAVLASGVPRTMLVDPARRDELWRDRKRWFFKPLDGYGSKAAYRGDKLTRATWESILARPYVAQQIVPPSERMIQIEEREVPLKLDVRAYVYDGAVQLTAARLYQGQTTNFRTAGGGFAPVFTEMRDTLTPPPERSEEGPVESDPPTKGGVVKIHLVTPRNPESFWTYDRILASLGKRCIFPNLSMPTVAGLTGREHEITLCDENVEDIDFDVAADIVGVTGYIVHKQRMLEIVDEFRRRGRFVVIGGPYASLCPEELRGRCDVLFVDEAEETWPQFLRDFQEGRWRTEYRPMEKPDLTSSPLPRFDLVPVERYHAMTIQFARGCPFNCEFCDIIVVYGRRPRVKAVDQVMAEIAECHRLGATQIFLVDDNFIGNKKLAKDLLRAIAAWSAANDHPMYFNTEVSLNVAQDDELLELLRAARFTTIFIGIESPRKASLQETKKTQNMRGDLVENVRKIQSYGIQVQAGMIVGFDNDDASIFAEQLRFIQDARIPVSMTGMLQAMPKTPLHERMAKEGRLIGDSVGDQFVFSNILPKTMSRIELYRGYRALIAELYEFRNFRRRTLEFILNRGRQVGDSVRPRREELRLLGRILKDTVLATSPRRAWFTLSLIGTTLWKNPARVADAVSFALVHKGLYEYMQNLDRHLERVIREIEEQGEALSPAAPSLATARA